MIYFSLFIYLALFKFISIKITIKMIIISTVINKINCTFKIFSFKISFSSILSLCSLFLYYYQQCNANFFYQFYIIKLEQVFLPIFPYFYIYVYFFLPILSTIFYLLISCKELFYLFYSFRSIKFTNVNYLTNYYYYYLIILINENMFE